MENIIGENIKKLLREHDKTQADLARYIARKTGNDPQGEEVSVTNWIKGKTRPRDKSLAMIASFFNTSIESLTDDGAFLDKKSQIYGNISSDTRSRLRTTGKRAIRLFGVKNQIRKVQEECMELIIEIQHYLDRGDEYMDGLVEEAADVIIMAEQLDQMFHLDEMVNKKLDKLDMRIRQEERQGHERDYIR